MTEQIAAFLLAAGLMTLPSMVAQVATERGVDARRAVQTVYLESRWNPEAVGDNGLAVGLWQFHGAESVGTWAGACELTGHAEWADDANRADPVRSTIVALDMIERGYGWLWTGWRMLGEGSDLPASATASL